MIKRDVVKLWLETELKHVKETYETDGVIDYPARCESWNSFTDGLIKSGTIPSSAANWTVPAHCETNQERRYRTDDKRERTWHVVLGPTRTILAVYAEPFLSAAQRLAAGREAKTGLNTTVVQVKASKRTRPKEGAKLP